MTNTYLIKRNYTKSNIILLGSKESANQYKKEGLRVEEILKELMPIMSSNTLQFEIAELKEKIETIHEQDFPYMNNPESGDENIEEYEMLDDLTDPEDIHGFLTDCLSNAKGILQNDSGSSDYDLVDYCGASAKVFA